MEYEKTAIAVLNKIGIEVVELSKWYCCGALYSLAVDDLMKHVGAVRTLINAQKQSREIGSDKLLTICPMCFNVLKRVNNLLKENPDKLETLSLFMDEEERYNVGISILHVVEILRENIDLLKKNLVRKPSNTIVSVYYGCTLVRPKNIGVDNPEDPTIVENLLRELGFNVVDHPFKTLCCGSYHVLDKREIVLNNSRRIIEHSVNRRVKVLVNVCPLCLYNLSETLKTMGKRIDLRIVYLTELLAYVMGLDEYLSSDTLEFFNTVFTHSHE